MEDRVFKTECQKERETRDLAIYRDYNNLVSNPENSRMLVTRHLMKKYGLHSPGTIYTIRKRVEKRLEEERS